MNAIGKTRWAIPEGYIPSQSVSQVQELDHFHIVVTLGDAMQKALPAAPRKTVYFDWVVDDPSQFGGAPDQVREAYEKTYQALRAQILDLVEAILGDEVQ